MINILIDRSGKTSKENIFLGNQHENLDETLHFSFPKEYDNFYKYITYSYTNNGCRITGISPLVDDNFVVTSKITKCAGVWELNLICKISPVNLDDKVIDLTENNSTKEHIFISNTISACVSGNSIDVEAFNNVAVDENIASLYDSVLALKNRVEENDKLHEQNEAIRKANELERQEAETTRKTNENERVSAEQLRVEAENTRKADETKRQSNESARIEAETNRDTAESERVNAENQRAEAETARQSAEANRASAENKRASAEENRDSAEHERVSAETLRKQAESARVSAETARTQAEANRVETEKVRVSAESARVQAEQSRVNAENLRVQAENERNSVITKLREDLDANTKADGKTQRSLEALWDLNKGISYKFESDTASAYQKQIPSGAKLGAVNKLGGRTIVFNQYANINDTEKEWADDSDFYNNLKESSNHKLYIMNKCAVTEILYDKETYNKRLILFDENDEGVVVVGNTNIKKKEIAVGKVFRNASIVQAPNNFKKIRLYNIGDDESGLTAKCDSWVEVIDLTKMFGSGNEPSTVEEFEAIFPNDYYPYNEGELMSMGVNDVDNVGKNYFDFSKLKMGSFVDYDKQTITIPHDMYNIGETQTLRELCPNITPGTYILSMNRSNPKSANFIYLSGYSNSITINEPIELTNAHLNGKVVFYNANNADVENVISNIQIEKATAATSYSPYKKETYTIPQAILDLEGYGWGSGTAYNYVDYENKKYYKNVGRVVLGSLNFKNDDKHYSFYSRDLRGYKKTNNNSVVPNIVCVKYETKPQGKLYNEKDMTGITVSAIYDGYLFINDSSFSDVETLKNSLQGVYLYYELAEPIVTDISDIIGDTFQEPFKVEANGSLTFKNSNGDGYKLAVPNDERYTIKLSEVTS